MRPSTVASYLLPRSHPRSGPAVHAKRAGERDHTICSAFLVLRRVPLVSITNVVPVAYCADSVQISPESILKPSDGTRLFPWVSRIPAALGRPQLSLDVLALHDCVLLVVLQPSRFG